MHELPEGFNETLGLLEAFVLEVGAGRGHIAEEHAAFVRYSTRSAVDLELPVALALATGLLYAGTRNCGFVRTMTQDLHSRR